ncbi:MAG: LysE family transporter [Sporolactobacillus sp.]
MAYLSGVMLGLMLQLSVGPVFFAILHLSIKKGFLEGIKMTCAVALVDAFYIGLSFTSMAALLHIPNIETFISFFGMIVLIYFGITFIKNARSKSNRAIAFEGNSFSYGIKITLINPLTLVFWSGTLGSLIAAHKLVGFVSTVSYALGCVTATFLFLGLTSLSGKYLNQRIDGNKLRFIDYAIGMILILFGIKMFLASLS